MLDRTEELKNMHSNELRELKNTIQKELDFRDDIGKEIQNITQPFYYKIEDSLYTKEDEERIRIYEERN